MEYIYSNLILENICNFREMGLPKLLSSAQMINLLSMKRENKNNVEEFLYLAVQDWILSDFEGRKQFISELFDKIHFEWISNKFFTEKIYINNNPLRKSHEFLNKLFDIQQLFMNNLKNSKDYNNLNFGEFLDKSFESSIHGVFDCKILPYDWIKKDFTAKIADANRITSGYTVINHNIFTCGGYTVSKVLKSCRLFSIFDHKWHTLPSMENTIMHPRAVTLHDKIYVCGGTSKSMHKLDINSHCWQTLSSFKRNAIKKFGFCSYDNCIYAVTNDCERFDPREGNWTTLANHECSINAAVGYENYIQSFNSDGAFSFDLRNNKWSEIIAKYPKRMTSPDACLVNNKIIVGGGGVNGKISLKFFIAPFLRQYASDELEMPYDGAFSLFGVSN